MNRKRRTPVRRVAPGKAKTPFDPTQWDCPGGYHGNQTIPQIWLVKIKRYWWKRGIAGPYPCCYDGAQRMMSVLVGKPKAS